MYGRRGRFHAPAAPRSECQCPPSTPTPPRAGVAVVDLPDSAAAKSWFAAEGATLHAAIRHAASTGFDTHAWQLSWSLDTYLHWRGH